MNFSIGDTIGGYEIVGVLGSGGMGEVYRVRNVISDRVDAMKVLLASLQRDQDFATRFLREIKVQARLVHPNIAQLYTAFEHQGNLMMILELVDGMSLLEMLQRGRIPLASAVDYASQALTALSYAHAQGVIHRDIKPGNIMVTRSGVVKLMDFGIAKAATDRSLTVTGNLIGSLYYMSPEQVRADVIDSRSDLYSVGVVLYQMATGRKPFEGASEYSIMRAQVENAPPPPNAIDTAVPEELSHIILRSLGKDPAERFQTGEEFREALQQIAVLLRENEIGVTRMLGGPASPAGVPARRPREVPTAPRERAHERPAGSTSRARGENPALAGAAETAARPQEDAPRAAGVPAGPQRRLKEPASRSRTPLWIASGIAVAVLVVAGTQVLDWMAAEKPDRPAAGTSASIDLQTPRDQPPARPSPRQQPPAGGEPESAARSTPPAPKEVAGQAAGVPSAAPAPDSTASRSTASEAPRKSAIEAPTGSRAASAGEAAPPFLAPSTPARVVRTPSVQSATSSDSPDETKQRSPSTAGPPAITPTQAAAGSAADTGVASAPTGAATKTANAPAEERPSSNTSAASPASPAPAPAPASAAIDRVYDPAEVDSPPRLLRQVQPRYTEAAQKAAVQGRVRLAAEIWPDGRAHNIRVVQSVGHVDLDRNAVAALSLWQFAPGRKDGVAVKVRALIDQTYRLQGGRSTPALSKDQ